MKQKAATVIIRSHHFEVRVNDNSVRFFVMAFSKPLEQFSWVVKRGRVTREHARDYFYCSPCGFNWRFHISLLSSFRRDMAAYPFARAVEFQTESLYEGQRVEHLINPAYTDRPYQTEAIRFLSSPILSDPENPRCESRLLRFRTGRGKSYTCMRAAQEVGERILCLVRATYVNKWVDDVKRTFVLEDDEIVVVQDGMNNFKKAIKNIPTYNKVKVFVFSLDTRKSWLRSYMQSPEAYKTLGIDFPPEEMYRRFGVGLRILDEVHQALHGLYMEDLFTHVPRSIGLSATLITRDPFVKKRQEELYPPHGIHADDAGVIYADACTVFFEFSKPQYIRTTAHGDTRWSHNEYENSILKHVPTRERYLELISNVVRSSFGQVRRSKKRLLILAFRIEMIDAIVKKLRAVFPHLRAESYVTGSDWAVATSADIIVSTYGKAGTAIDLADLTNLLVTINMAADHANLQIVGRLRQLSDGHPVLMECLVPMNIEKAVKTDKDRRAALVGYVRNNISYNTAAII